MSPVLFPIRPVAIGYLHLPAGPGHRINAGAGRHSIMAAGPMIRFTAGCGCPGMNGAPHGLAGGQAEIIMDGRRLHPASISA